MTEKRARTPPLNLIDWKSLIRGHQSTEASSESAEHPQQKRCLHQPGAHAEESHHAGEEKCGENAAPEPGG